MHKIDIEAESTLYHESGHAAVWLLSEDAMGAPSLICALADGDRLGFVTPSPEAIRTLSGLSPEAIRAYGRMLAAGRAAEYLAGFPSEGSYSDIEKLSKLARLAKLGPEFERQSADGAELQLRARWSGVKGIVGALRESGRTLEGESGMEVARAALYQKPVRPLTPGIERLAQLVWSLRDAPEFAEALRLGIASITSPKTKPSSSRMPKPASTRRPL